MAPETKITGDTTGLPKSRRRLRRERLKPRLRATSEPDGWTLTVPPPAALRTMRWAIGAVTALVVGILLVAVGTVPALLVLVIGACLVSFTFLAAPPTTRLRILRDGTSSVAKGGRPPAIGRAGDVSIEIGYDDVTALGTFEWSQPRLSFRGLGNDDLARLKEFCGAANVPFKLVKTAEQVDGRSGFRETLNR